MKKITLFFALFVVLVGGGGAIAWSLGYFRAQGAPVVFEVNRGENFVQIARRLQAAGVITNDRAFRWYVTLFRSAKPLQRGEFQLVQNQPIPDVITALTEGKPIEYKITVPEGYNIFQVGDLLELKGIVPKTDFLAAARDPKVLALLPVSGVASIEGFIYPETYFLQKVFTAREVAQIFVKRFSEVYREIKPEIEASRLVTEMGWQLPQVLTMASIVEKETGAGFERPLIASVFVNRLRKRMRLQTDPTVIYALWLKTGTWNGNISRRDLDDKNAYNTYAIYGLPPGPIASPGISAIKAVLNPASSDYLYFVSKNDGTHVFSVDYGGHQKAVTATQSASARKGKSWRDLPESEKANRKQ